jgi:predicted nucleotidyltransferase
VPDPTRFPELNAVLANLVDGVVAALGENLCGVYLQGSFAVGDADEFSDVDFVVVTHEDLSPAEQAALRELHARIHDTGVEWAQHLEGSYVSAARLRRVDPERTKLFYLDNGARDLIWDDHCNTAVVRWTLREHGVALAGPDPRGLIDPVSEESLRAEARAAMRAYDEWARESAERYRSGDLLSFSRWKQPYLVITFCRILFTLDQGTVASKRQSGEWALDALEEEWAPLIRCALDDRPDPWGRVHRPAEPAAVEETVAFAAYAVGR